MKCPICDDELTVSATECSFCRYDFRTGKRGMIEAPPSGAAAKARRDGVGFLVVGIPAILLSAGMLIVPILPFGRLLALFVFIPGAGGIVAKGMVQLRQARRWDLKQRLHDEMKAGAAHGPTTPVGA